MKSRASRFLVILLVGSAVSAGWLGLGATNWADQIRSGPARRGPAPAPTAAPSELPTSGEMPVAPAARGPGPGRGGAGGGRGGRGGRGQPGLFTHYQSPQNLRGNVMRFGQILLIQLAVPGAVTLGALAVSRRRRRMAR